MSEASEFVVHVNGAATRSGWEISLLKPAFAHGAKSYGWFGPEKLPVATVESWMLREVTDAQIDALWTAGIAAAHQALAALTHPVQSSSSPQQINQSGL